MLEFTRKVSNDRFIAPRNASRPCPRVPYPSGPPTESLETYDSFLSKGIFAEPMVDEFSSGHQSYSMGAVRQLLSKREEAEVRPSKRALSLSPEKVLDAPEIKDDYYLNLLDWSSRGILSIGLGERVYLYSPHSIRELCYKSDDYICSLSFHPTG
jgi:hypothetical protein